MFPASDETAESMLLKATFVVEASDMEQSSLWDRHAAESPERIDPTPVEWKQRAIGWCVEVGKLDERPVCIDLNFAYLNASLVCFWNPSSQVVDHAQIEVWFAKNFCGTWDGGRRATCDAMNFHHCLKAIGA